MCDCNVSNTACLGLLNIIYYTDTCHSESEQMAKTVYLLKNA